MTSFKGSALSHVFCRVSRSIYGLLHFAHVRITRDVLTFAQTGHKKRGNRDSFACEP
jgi:hypothetical protein